MSPAANTNKTMESETDTKSPSRQGHKQSPNHTEEKCTPSSSQLLLPIPLYIPNIIGYIRILFAFIGLYTSFVPPYPVFTIVIWTCAGLLDMIDGILARWLEQTSTFGVYIDIIADNILRSACWVGAIVMYVATATTTNNNTEAEPLQPSSSTHHQQSTSINGLYILVPTFLISLEWITMVCTQLQSIQDQQHWKEKELSSPHDDNDGTENEIKRNSNDDDQEQEEQPLSSTPYPWWIQELFRNNFKNPLGILSIWGLFATPIVWYARNCNTTNTYIAPIVVMYDPQEESKDTITMVLFESFTLLTYAGRLISACCEGWLCLHYMKTVLRRDELQKQKQQRAKGQKED